MAGERKKSRMAMPLRRVIVLIAIGGVLVASLVLSLLYTTSMRANLYEHIDERLHDSIAKIDKRSHKKEDAGEAVPPDEASTDARAQIEQLLMRPGRGNPDLAIVLSPLGETAAGVVRDGVVQRLPSDTIAEAPLELRPGEIATSVFSGDLGGYRFISGVDSSGSTVLLGVPLAETEAILAESARTAVWATILVAGAAGALTLLLTRRALRPLEEVVETAARVSRADLVTDRTALQERVAPQAADERTEAGRVGAALNRLLEHVTEAFRQRELVEQRLRVFVADASHELRTPLASVRGYAELTRLSGEELPPDSAHALSRIEAESTRMSGIVEDLLLLARLDQRLPPRSEEVDLGVVLRDVVADARVAAPAHELEVQVGDGPLGVLGDPDRLRQALGNVVSNAWQHTPDGTRIVVRGESRTAGRVVITVHDTGPGLPEGFETQLFERFVRADVSRSRARGGAGLGLSISKSVIEAHGGTIAVSSEPGNTVFRIELPA